MEMALAFAITSVGQTARRTIHRHGTRRHASEGPRIPVIYSDDFLEHFAGRAHPERPARLEAVIKRIRNGADLCDRVDIAGPAAEDSLVAKYIRSVHFEDYVNEVERMSGRGGVQWIDGDTYVNENTFRVATDAARAWLDAVDVAVGGGGPAFALTRPPGHHATAATGMGFCIFSNAAIAASYALEHHGLARVSILDWDVHHGNGTESWVKKEPRVRMTSSHQWPAYPGTGGIYDKKFPNVRNVQLEPSTTWSTYEPRFRTEMLPFIAGAEWPSPDLVIVSAGYDALANDPLAAVALQPEDFGQMTKLLFEHLGHTRVIFGLEGGYELSGLSDAVAATLQACIDATCV